MLRPAALLVAAMALAGCPRPTSPATPPVPVPVPAPVAPAAPVRLADGDLAVFTADADAAYWYADGQVWRRAGTGAATAVAPLAEPPRALRTYAGRLYALGEAALWVIADGAARPIATALPAWTVAALDADGAWFGTTAGVYRVPLRGGPPEQLASGLGAVDALGTDGDAVYAIARSRAADATTWRQFPQQEILGIGKRDGAVRTLAARQYGAFAPLVLGGRLYWSSATYPAVASVELATGLRRVVLRGNASAMVTDGRRLLLGSDGEALAELDGARRLVADGVPGQVLDLQTAPMVAAGDGVVAVLRASGDGAASLWWLPRPGRTAHPATLIAAVDHPASHVVVDGATIAVAYHTQRGWARPGSRVAHVVQIDAAGRERELLRGDRATALALAGARVAVGIDRAVWLIDGAAPPRLVARDLSAATGVALIGDALWWGDGNELWHQPTAGGDPARAYRPDRRAASTSWDRAAIVAVDDAVVFGTLGVGADAIRRWRAGQVEALYAPDDPAALGEALVRVGPALVATTSDGALVRIPLAGGAARRLALGDDVTPLRLFGGRSLAVMAQEPDGVRLLDVDPRTGQRRRRFGLPGYVGLDAFAATSDDRAIYAFLAGAHWLIAIPR